MKKSKFTARDVEVLSRISAALQVIDHDVTELNAVLLKVGERVKEPVKPSKKLPEIGDKILVTDDVLPYFSKGDIALVIEVNEEQHHVTANFKDLGNPKVYSGDYWCIHFDNLEVVPHADEASK
jgi:hypothetical protein